MNRIIYFLLIFILSIFQLNAQTFKKEASNPNPYIGEEFYYTITVSNLNNLSDFNEIIDELPVWLDYEGFELLNNMRFLTNSPVGGCSSVVGNYDATTRKFKLKFNNCSGTIIGINNFSFKLKVKLNKYACDESEIENTAEFHKSDGTIIKSNETVIVNTNNPTVLQKTFREFSNGELVYDIRLTSNTGNFHFFDPNEVYFKDVFTIPGCLDISSSNSASVFYVSNVNNIGGATLVNSSNTLTNNQLQIDFKADPSLVDSTSVRSSLLYLVKIKVNNCSCSSGFFDIVNDVELNAKDVCGRPIQSTRNFTIKNLSCFNNEPDIGVAQDSISVEKSFDLGKNQLGLTMKGCKGKYIITIRNPSTNLVYDNIKVIDDLPSEVEGSSLVRVIYGNARASLNGNRVNIHNTSDFNPNDSIMVEIPFKVIEPRPNITFQNCGTLWANGYNHRNRTFTNTKEFCSPTITTVPNEVALHTVKYICGDTPNECGIFSTQGNRLLPGDEIDYVLHFYNYGTAEGRNIVLMDQLPDQFYINNSITDVQVYKYYSGNPNNGCEVEDFTDITSSVRVSVTGLKKYLNIDFLNHSLPEFTCDGVTHFKVVVTARVKPLAPNGTYFNQFLVNYTTPEGNNKSQVSNEVQSTILKEQLVLGNKSAKAVDDCLAKTKTVDYEIKIANISDIELYVDINDILTPPSPVTVISVGGLSITSSANPTLNVTPNTFNNSLLSILRLKVEKCDIITIRFQVVYNTIQVGKNQIIPHKNEATVRAYKPGAQIIVVGNPRLIQMLMEPDTDEEKLEAVEFIKASKRNPDILKGNDYKLASTLGYGDPTKDKEFGTSVLESSTITFDDCMSGRESACLSDSNEPLFDFNITSLERTGLIKTTLNNNSGKKITKIQYVLTDVRSIQTCEDFTVRGRPYSCNGCEATLSPLFNTVNLSPIGGGLVHQNVPSGMGYFYERNKVEFQGSPTTVVQDVREFIFPTNLDCNGNFEFTITAIVFFDDCSVCYVSDNFDYNATKVFIHNPNPRNPGQITPRN